MDESQVKWKERYGKLRVTTDKIEQRAAAYRALALRMYSTLLNIMISERDDAKQAALFAQLKEIEGMLSTLNEKPIYLKSKI